MRMGRLSSLATLGMTTLVNSQPQSEPWHDAKTDSPIVQHVREQPG
jgi:hypothetical protein